MMKNVFSTRNVLVYKQVQLLTKTNKDLQTKIMVQVHVKFLIFVPNFFGGNFFSRGDYSWDGGSTLPQNSYKSSRDLWEATYKCNLQSNVPSLPVYKEI